jgi:hypothetical protein
MTHPLIEGKIRSGRADGAAHRRRHRASASGPARRARCGEAAGDISGGRGGRNPLDRGTGGFGGGLARCLSSHAPNNHLIQCFRSLGKGFICKMRISLRVTNS